MVSNRKFKEQNQINVNYLLDKLEVLEFSSKCAFYYGELRTDLKHKGIIIGNNDLLIASHSFAEDTTLVTNNAEEFTRVKGLKIID